MLVKRCYGFLKSPELCLLEKIMSVHRNTIHSDSSVKLESIFDLTNVCSYTLHGTSGVQCVKAVF